MTDLTDRALRMLGVVAASASMASTGFADVIRLTGTDFVGGGGALFNRQYRGEKAVNAVYARPTGEMSRLSAKFTLNDVPAGSMVLQLRACDDDRAGASDVAITINGHVLLNGKNEFPDADFADRQLPIPDDVLRRGDNELSIESTEGQGSAGSPPWFMVAAATITSPAALPLPENFRVTIPLEERPFPEAPSRPDAPHFKWRGTKGWAWTMQQYLDEIPHLKRVKMNFLMNCYLSMFNAESPGDRPWSGERRNSWWLPFAPERKQRLQQIVAACKANDITFCFAMHPQIYSDRPMKLTSDEDFEAFFAHFAWMQSQGVKWFSVSMDDVNEAHAGSAHAKFCNKFLKRLRERDPEAQLIFCPTVYHNAAMKGNEGYLTALATEMDQDVYVFWTGADVVPLTMTRQDAVTYRDLVKHRLFIWENYPVNDSSPTLHLGPITGRDPELCKVADGYMANPLYPQAHANRIPLYTMGDFASNPYGYDPSRSIGQTILQLAETPEERRAMADLIQTYLGDLAYSATATNFNAPQHEYERLTSSPAGERLGAIYIQFLDEMLQRTRGPLTAGYPDMVAQLARDIASLRATQAAKYPPTPASAPAPH